MKKAFSLAELMVALLIMSVIAAVLIPTIMDISPNNEKFLFKSAYRTVESVVNELVNDNGLYPSGTLGSPAVNDLCTNFSDRLNLIGEVNCTGADTKPPGPLTGPGEANEPNFITANGMMWWGFAEAEFAERTDPTWPRNTEQILVDVNGSDGDGVLNEDIFRIQIDFTGKLMVNDVDIGEVEALGGDFIDAGDNSRAVEYLKNHSND